MFPVKLLRRTSFQLALFYAGLFMVSVLVLFAITYWAAADYAAKDVTDEIGVEYAALQDEAALAGIARLPEIIENHLRQRRGERAIYLLQGPDGTRKAGNIPAMAPREGAMMMAVPWGDRHVTMHAHGYRLADGDYLLIGEDANALTKMKVLIARAFGFGMLVTLILALAGGVIVSNGALRRVENVSQTTRAIVAGDLSRRVRLRGTDDEFDHLAVSINAMLDRIEELMHGMQQVSNDIAHDLRTPLSRLRQRLEYAAEHGQSTDELRKALNGAIDQVDMILRTFAALLRIAQVGSGQRAAPLEPLDISAVLGAVADDFAPAIEDHGQNLRKDIAAGLRLLGDRELLTQMIVNLLDNAVRHALPGAEISVSAHQSGGMIEVVIADTGPGIPAAERDNVLRPFYRLEASRTTEGSGLGLSLVAAIVKQHRAKLALSDNNPGLCVIILFPGVANQPVRADGL